jgi:PEP-CTERM motif
MSLPPTEIVDMPRTPNVSRPTVYLCPQEFYCIDRVIAPIVPPAATFPCVLSGRLATGGREYLMRAVTRYFVLAATVVVVAGNAEAGSITYIGTGSGSGSLGTFKFTDALVTLTAVADTDNITPGVGGFVAPADSATVDVAGIGTATFTVPVIVYDAQALLPAIYPQGGFGLELSGPGEIFFIMNFVNNAFEGYNLAASIGPLTAPEVAGNGPGPNFPAATSLGSFIFTTSQGTFTFQAIAASTVPEPSSLVGASIGILMLAGYAWRRRPRPRRAR